MRLVVMVYALSSGASLLSFFVSALWGGTLALRKQGVSEIYKLALVAAHLIMTLSFLLLLILALTQVLQGSGLSLIYSLVALGVVPCVYAYLPKEQPRYRVLSLALASLFASGMVLRSLQVLHSSQVLPSPVMQRGF